MRRYGLDGATVWHKGPAALGHQMTHITPESLGERLPLADQESELAITADARLDNRRELIDKLAFPTTTSNELSDSELILLSYRKWGLDCVRHLLGDFAFAIWDAKAHRLFCARDFVGSKPLYYFHGSRHFCFASDIDAILNSPHVPNDLDLSFARTLVEYAISFHTQRTFWRGVFKLPPAHTLIVGRDGIRQNQYWRPGKTKEIRYRDSSEYVEALRELLVRAIDCRLRSAFAVGSHLSGGLDSSTLAVLAARSLRQRCDTLHAFSWSPPPSENDYPLNDEREVVESICHRERIMLHFTALSPSDAVEYALEDITTNPTETALHERVVAGVAHQEGIRVMLSGWGGDEVAAFNGRGYFAELFAKGRWSTLLRELRAQALVQGSDWRADFRSRVMRPLTPDFLLRMLRPNAKEFPRPFALSHFLQSGFAARLNQVPLLDTACLGEREHVGVRRNQIELLNHGHLAWRMESWAALGGRHGIEYRYPLLDKRIVDYCLSIPADLFFKQGWKRYLFRKTVQGTLPHEVQWARRKADPAVHEGLVDIWHAAEPMIVQKLQAKSQMIESAGYLAPGPFFASLHPQMKPDLTTDSARAAAHHLMWLACMRQ